jgi:hypothetical protein
MLKFIKKILGIKKQHIHKWHCDFNSKNAYCYYCNECPQLSIVMHGESEHKLLDPIITEFDNEGNYNGPKKRIR